MKKVLLVAPISTTSWGTNNAGGVDSVAQSLVQALQERESSDFYYRVAAIDPYSNHRYSATPLQLSPYVELVHIPANEYIAKLKIPGFISQTTRIHREIFRFQPDIVHAHSLNWLLGVRSKNLRIATAHAYKKIGRNSVSPLNDLIYETIFPLITDRFIDALTSVGKNLQTALSNDFQKSVFCIENPINRDFFSKRHDFIKKSEPISVVTCAIITRRKRIERCIQLIKDLAESGYPAKLTIIGKVGDKKYYEELLSFAQSLRIPERVFFVGHLTRKEIISQYIEADLGVFTSEDETFGLAPLEMLATGLPVYTTCVGIIEERKAEFENHGVKMWSDNTGERVSAVMQLLNTPSTGNCQNWIHSQFSATSIVAKYERLYAELMNEKRC